MLNWLKTYREYLEYREYKESRNLARTTVIQEVNGQGKRNQPLYTNWTLEKAVRDGYKANGWVYRAVYLITKAASSVHWMVYDDDTLSVERPEHPITALIIKPNSYISRQDLFELLVSWLQLAGNSYLLKNKPGKNTMELWPISPDQINPVPSNRVDEWMKGYLLRQDKIKDKNKEISYPPEMIIHHKFFNPADPLLGIAPLEAASKTVDIDNDQKDFNKSTSQNRGIIDGVFAFKREFSNQQQADAVGDALEERYKGKRRFAVIGSEAEYHRTALTPQEMDYTNSRIQNRNEIFSIFGVPPQLAGAMEASTYNNFQVAESIFWVNTIIPLLDDIADTFNFSFQDELNGMVLSPQLGKVPAVRRMMMEKSKTATELSTCGVPFERINRALNMGIEEYPGWDMPMAAPQATGKGTSKEPSTEGG